MGTETSVLDFAPGVHTAVPFYHERGKGSLWSIFKGFVDTALHVSAAAQCLQLNAPWI